MTVPGFSNGPSIMLATTRAAAINPSTAIGRTPSLSRQWARLDRRTRGAPRCRRKGRWRQAPIVGGPLYGIAQYTVGLVDLLHKLGGLGRAIKVGVEPLRQGPISRPDHLLIDRRVHLEDFVEVL